MQTRPAVRRSTAAARGSAASAGQPYRLVRTPPPARRPLVPDAEQAEVLSHAGGPLLVLAGPGTGKTTTLVEAVARQIEGGLAPEAVLVLTFSRKAAHELRERIAARLGTASAGVQAWTFHAFCYALLRSGNPETGREPLRLLSGPEQDVALRELLIGSRELGRSWPEPLAGCLTTRGLAEQVRALLSRAREVGLDPGGLAAVAAAAGRADWAALAGFFEDYLDVLDLQGALDYAELVHRAVLLVEDPDRGPEIAARFGAVFVDEYQDTDPAQERLLQGLAGGGRDLVVVGDPDQAIYAFRGAEVAGLLGFPDRFRRADGAPAPVLALRTCRRSGPALLRASRAVAAAIPAPGLPGAALRTHRELAPLPGAPSGTVEAVTHPSVGAEADAIAELLRREHLERGTPWSRMAVLVRSGARSVPLLRRVLSAAGVPLEVAGDELPLAREPAVAPLLLGLRVAAEPAALTAETARTLLLSPLCGADPAALRRLGRALRGLDRVAATQAQRAGAPARLPTGSDELVRAALADPGVLVNVDERTARPAQRLADLLARCREALAAGPEQALWQLWSGSAWPQRLEAASLAGGATGRAADRDLDAVVALFATVARADEAGGPGRVSALSVAAQRAAAVRSLVEGIAAQQIPADTLAERGVRGEAVRLLTARRSKGLEWDVVIVSGVQEGVWPDLRRRSSLLEADRLGVDGLREPVDRAQLLADERRLFYVALTRARRRVVVTAVAGLEQDGERPSRFLDELGVAVEQRLERTARPLSLPALVAGLRRTAADPARTPAARRAAATRLARLAAALDEAGEPLVPAADPARWWGLAEVSESQTPVHPPDAPVPLSGTSLSGLETCPLRWFLEHEVHAQQPASAAMAFGGVVHALADEVATGRSPAELAVLTERLDTVWSSLAYDAAWQSAQQREQAREALQRFLVWHVGARDRRPVASEIGFAVELDLPGGRVVLRGFLDRVELDRDGRVHVVDLKTGRTAVTGTDLATHPQLGTYQLAVRSGALDEVLPDRPAIGGAELVQLRLPPTDGAGVASGPKVQQQAALQPAGPGALDWVETLLDTAVRRVLGESFPPTPNERCPRCPFASCCPAQAPGRQVIP